MAKKPKRSPLDDLVDDGEGEDQDDANGEDPAARERFREWCRQEIEKDPRFEHAIVVDMLMLYAEFGGLQARDDAIHLLANLGKRVERADASRRTKRYGASGSTVRRDRQLQNADKDAARAKAKEIWATDPTKTLTEVGSAIHLGYPTRTIENWIRDLNPNFGRRGRRTARKSPSTP